MNITDAAGDVYHLHMQQWLFVHSRPPCLKERVTNWHTNFNQNLVKGACELLFMLKQRLQDQRKLIFKNKYKHSLYFLHLSFCLITFSFFLFFLFFLVEVCHNSLMILTNRLGWNPTLYISGESLKNILWVSIFFIDIQKNLIFQIY